MKRAIRSAAPQRASRRLRTAAIVVVTALSLLGAPAWSHDHDPEESGNPLRIAAYILHPVGVILDTLIFRPAHWLVSHEPLSTLFGHEEN